MARNRIWDRPYVKADKVSPCDARALTGNRNSLHDGITQRLALLAEMTSLRIFCSHYIIFQLWTNVQIFTKVLLMPLKILGSNQKCPDRADNEINNNNNNNNNNKHSLRSNTKSYGGKTH